MHIIPKTFSYLDYQKKSLHTKLNHDAFSRSLSCKVLVTDINPCKQCHSHNLKCVYDNNKKVSHMKEPAKLNAPIKYTSSERIKFTLQNERLKCKQFESQIMEMKADIEVDSKNIDPDLNKYFITLFSGCDKKNILHFMKLFWEEQQKYIQASNLNSIRNQPMGIKFCLNLAAKSSSSYSDLRYDCITDSGILVL